jgi:hypothetical protein
MFLGHYGLAFATKRAAPRTSLGTTFFAAQFLDELWPILLLAGIERVRIVPGLMAANVLDFEFYPYSHSLVAALAWAVLIGLAYFALRRCGRGAWIVAACVASHWFLDVPMHRPDLPLYPGSRTLVGLGLWNSVPLTLIVELALFALGLAVYLRDTRARDRVGSWGLWAMVALLAAFFLGGTFGGTPPSVRSLALSALGLWLFVPWAWRVDGHRDSSLLLPPASRHDSHLSPSGPGH